ncbi:hypothetical protein Gotur_025308, partial [Gossypium turneri]
MSNPHTNKKKDWQRGRHDDVSSDGSDHDASKWWELTFIEACNVETTVSIQLK